jgi:hypothetical protein
VSTYTRRLKTDAKMINIVKPVKIPEIFGGSLADKTDAMAISIEINQ